MLAVRDQENLVHARQTAAAGKPLNQGIRALAPKTPGGPKTPFGAGQHDENRPLDFKVHKTIGKDVPGKLGKNSFVTPLAPRNRAPLGAKTTNVKAQAFRTPAPVPLIPNQGRTVQKATTVRRSGRSKIVVAPSEPIETTISTIRSAEEEEPDFGYAPPPPADLPDPPLEFNEDPLLTRELLQGYGELFCHSPKDKSGISGPSRNAEDDDYLHQGKQGGEVPTSSKESTLLTDGESNKKVDAMIAAGPKKVRTQISRVDTMKARSAVEALSELQPRLPAVASKPTHASEQKAKRIIPIVKYKRPAVQPPSLSTHPGRAAVSKNTIGFPKAKKAPSIIPTGGSDGTKGVCSSSIPKQISQTAIHPKDFRDLYGSPPVESDMWFRLKEFELLEQDMSEGEDDEAGTELFNTDVLPFGNSKLGDDDDFQLPMPE